MAEENLPTEEKVRRSVGRTVRRGLLLSVVLAVLILWASLGVYTLEPGRAAVILRFGKHMDTVTQEGLNFTLPPPLNERLVVDVDNIRNEDFGFRGKEGEPHVRRRIDSYAEDGWRSLTLPAKRLEASEQIAHE